MKGKLLLAGIAQVVLAAATPRPAQGSEFVHETFTAKAHPGSRERQYQVFIPSSYDPRTPVPMLMVLHGCLQTEQNAIDETNFKQLAERDDFIVVYPFITSYQGSRSKNCWGFWFPEEIHEGAGEVEDLYQIALEVEARHAIDPERRYVTGLSSGAGMAVALSVAQSEYFAAAGAAAGLPYAESSWSVSSSCFFPGWFQSIGADVAAMQKEEQSVAERRVVPMMTIQSSNDCVVHERAAQNIRDAWLQRYGVSATAFETSDCTREGVSCSHAKYGSPGHSVIETVFYEGASGSFFGGKGSHYWVGDNAGDFANPDGPSASELLWDFFKAHRFSENPPPASTPTALVTPAAPAGEGPSAAPAATSTSASAPR
jgi:poly(hydroxyalkanoate) depolymerase family esterase